MTIVYAYFLEAIKQIPEVIQVKGRGLMLGVEFDFDVVHFVKDDYRQTYFFGNANNKNLLRFYLL
jgi:acetylornithine aminotransferase